MESLYLPATEHSVPCNEWTAAKWLDGLGITTMGMSDTVSDMVWSAANSTTTTTPYSETSALIFPTATAGQRLAAKKLYRFSAEVRTRDDIAAVRATLDGEPIVDWQGRSSALSLDDAIRLPSSDVFAISVWDTSYEIRSLTLTMLGGQAENIHGGALPTVENAIPAGEPTYLSGLAGTREGVRAIPEESSVVVAGVQSPHGILLPPEQGQTARIQYHLDHSYEWLAGGTGVNDTSNGPRSDLTFRIIGDGRELWASRPGKTLRKVQFFRTYIGDVKELELVVECAGSADEADAVWVEPALYGKVSASDVVAAGETPSVRDQPKNQQVTNEPTGQQKEKGVGTTFFGIPIE